MTMHLGEATIGSGSTGAEVKQIQQILQGQGYNVGPVDGIYGPQTQSAVQAFQRTKGLLPDGIVGPLTWNALQGKAPEPTPMPAPVPAPRPGGSEMFSFLDNLSMPMMLGLGVGVLVLFSGRKKRR